MWGFYFVPHSQAGSTRSNKRVYGYLCLSVFPLKTCMFFGSQRCGTPPPFKKNPNQISKLIDFSVYKVGRAGPTTLLSKNPNWQRSPFGYHLLEETCCDKYWIQSQELNRTSKQSEWSCKRKLSIWTVIWLFAQAFLLSLPNLIFVLVRNTQQKYESCCC